MKGLEILFEYIVLKLKSKLKLKVYFVRTYNDNMLMYENEHTDIHMYLIELQCFVLTRRDVHPLDNHQNPTVLCGTVFN